MNYLARFFVIFTLFSGLLSDNIYARTSIQDPSITKMCKELENKRNRKVVYRVRIKEYIQKIDYAYSRIKKSQKKVKTKLDRISAKLAFEMKTTQGRIDTISEQIIRGGCPPINYKGQIIQMTSTKEELKRTFKELDIEKLELENIENFNSL